MKKLIPIALVFVLASCFGRIEHAKKPDNLIPRDKMVQVITELVKLESYIQSSYPSVAEYNKVMINSSDKLFRRLGITDEQFEASMNYYGSHQKMMKEIYNDALDELNSELGELEASKDKKKSVE